MGDLPLGTVTFVFTDVEGSTRLLYTLGDRYAKALAEHRRALREVFAAHSGHEIDMQGDSFFYVFTDATAAIAAAAEMQLALTDSPLRVRIGLHTGEPLVTDDGYIGIDVHRAARIAACGHGGQVVLSEQTQRLIGENTELRDLGFYWLKDLQATEHIFQLGPDQFPPLRTAVLAAAIVGNIPAELTSFIDRKRELETLRVQQARSRLVTLTGPGGCGKSRIALRLAAELAPHYECGVWLVELAPVRDPSLLDGAVAAALGKVEEPGRSIAETLSEALQKGPTILTLDTCEHLIDKVADFAHAQLRACPQLRIIATSREALRIRGETVFRVDPFEIPKVNGGTADVGAVASSPAAQLFVERAASYAPDFQLTPSNAVDISAICARIDGLPLAIELAAAEVQVLSTKQIAERLLDPLEMVVGELRDEPTRHRSIQATIAWSYNLLAKPERALLRRLSVFAGSFDLTAAESVCSGRGVPQELVGKLLASLIARSLVVAESGRFQQLDTIRDYGARLLRHGTERDEVHRRLVAYCLSRLDAHAAMVSQPYLVPLSVTMQHVDTALDWCTIHDPRQGLELAVATAPFWLESGYPSAARRRLLTLLALQEAGDSEHTAQAWMAVGRLAYLQGDLDEAGRQATSAIAHAERSGDMRLLAQAEMLTGMVALAGGDTESAKRAFEAELAASIHAGDKRGEAYALHQLGSMFGLAGNHQAARERLMESVALREDLSDHAGTIVSLTFLGGLDFLDGDFGAARPWLNDALAIGRRTRDSRVAYTLDVLAAMSVAVGNHHRALRLTGASDNLRSAVGWWTPSAWTALVKQAIEPARRLLGDDVANAERARGEALEFDAAVDLGATALGG